MAIYNLHTASVEHTIFYRFSCGRCGKMTDWIPYKVGASCSLRGSGTYDATQLERQAVEGANQALKEKIDRMKAHIEIGYYFQAPFSENTEHSYFLEKKCPYCKAVQKSKKGGIWSVFTFGLLPSGILIIISGLADAMSNGIGIAAIVLYLLGTVYGALWYRKRRKSAGTGNAAVPEYNWNGM